jgi:hypothetical protein
LLSSEMAIQRPCQVSTKDKGIIYVAVPDMLYTFDCKRKITPLSHLIDDFEKNADSVDQNHLTDFVEKFDYGRTNGISRKQLLVQVRDKPESLVRNQALIMEEVQEMCEYMGTKMVDGTILRNGALHLIGQKLGAG